MPDTKPRGRPKGSKNKTTQEVKELLDGNKLALVQRAIVLATHKSNPNIPVLLKLLDKILPTLSMAEFEANLRGSLIQTLTETQLQDIVNRIGKQTK